MAQCRRMLRLAGTNIGICLLAYMIMTVIGVDVLVLTRAAVFV